MFVKNQTLSELKKEFREDDITRLFTEHNMSKLLEDNRLLGSYVHVSMPVINAFLLGGDPEPREGRVLFYPDTNEVLVLTPERDPRLGDLMTEQMKINVRENFFNTLKNNYIPMAGIIYTPITPFYMQNFIQLDEFLRLSKYWNNIPIRVFRGTVALKDASMGGLNSFSRLMAVAGENIFARGSIFVSTLGEKFPYLKVNETNIPLVDHEEEVLLPPCDFEVEKQQLPIKHNKVFDVRLRPRSLAKVMLERMKNPPADYPRKFLTDPMYDYDKALKMLEEYVKNDVENHIIRVNDTIIEELPDPEVRFLYEDEAPTK